MDVLRIAGAQINPVVGDLVGNAEMVRRAMDWAETQHADVLLLPELALSGYPPEDLVLRRQFRTESLATVERLAEASGRTVTVVGFVEPVDVDEVLEDSQPRTAANSAAVLAEGRLVGIYRKVLLPNYAVFDEARYFVAGDQPDMLWNISGIPMGISVCEDIWSPEGPPALQAAAGARILLNINGSPYHAGKGTQRAALLAAEAQRAGVPLVYLNMVGGQDDLIFDGDSMVFDGNGALRYRAGQFTEERFVLDLPVPEASPPSGAAPVIPVTGRRHTADRPVIPASVSPDRLDPEAEIYTALVTALGDYVAKNGFDQVLIGLSGGIDSALTCAIAVDALGPDRVWGVTMPSRYSSTGSWRDSEDVAKRLGCRFDVIPIDDIFTGFLGALAPVFTDTQPGVAEENLQARIRGAILMALSNKFGPMVVATGNKSEMAVGYATLYGDMAGGYAVLKDVLKTVVYRLAVWRNRDGEVIPQDIIDKPPSAELRPDQKDSDSLPEYDVLDEVLVRYIDEDLSVEEIIAAGVSPQLVHRVASMVDRNEYKRRQAAPGARISTKAFGKDRRLPITNGYRPNGTGQGPT